MKENYISECINGDIGLQVLNKDDIVALCFANRESDSSEDEDDTDELVGSTHGEVTTMLEGLMTYFKIQINASTAELFTLKRL